MHRHLRQTTGKFNFLLDAWVYAASLNGTCDAEAGSVSDHGVWFGMMRDGKRIFEGESSFREKLTDRERAFIDAQAGVILREDDLGFVQTDYYSDPSSLNRAWSAIEADIEARDAGLHELDAPEPTPPARGRAR